MSSGCPGDDNYIEKHFYQKISIFDLTKRWFGERPGRKVGEPDTPDCEEGANVEEDEVEEEEEELEEEEEEEEYSEEEYSEEEE